MDREKLKQAAALILEAVGQDGRDGTKETPERFAKMMEERLAYAGGTRRNRQGIRQGVSLR